MDRLRRLGRLVFFHHDRQIFSVFLAHLEVPQKRFVLSLNDLTAKVALVNVVVVICQVVFIERNAVVERRIIRFVGEDRTVGDDLKSFIVSGVRNKWKNGDDVN